MVIPDRLRMNDAYDHYRISILWIYLFCSSHQLITISFISFAIFIQILSLYLNQFLSTISSVFKGVILLCLKDMFEVSKTADLWLNLFNTILSFKKFFASLIIIQSYIHEKKLVYNKKKTTTVNIKWIHKFINALFRTNQTLLMFVY